MSSIGCQGCGQVNPPEARFCANCGSVLGVVAEKPLPAVTSTTELAAPGIAAEYMDFGIRLVAALIDGAIIFVVYYALSFIRGVAPLLMFLVLFLYYWLFTGLKGQTPGKMVVGIKVVNANGTVPGLGYAALREVLGKFISTIVIMLGFFWILWNDRKQGLHDMIAGTFVVRVPSKRW